MPFQYAGVEYGLARDHFLLGDAPGLGKTCQSILTLRGANLRGANLRGANLSQAPETDGGWEMLS